MSIAVRIAQAADADGISRVILAALHSSNARDYPADVIARVAGNFTPDAVLELLRRRSVLVAVQDEVIVATGVTPRDPGIEGQDHPKVLSYIDVLAGNAEVGEKVAVIGAGGIGFDVTEFLVQEHPSPTVNVEEWLEEWGVGDPEKVPGGLAAQGPKPSAPARQVTLLQRKTSKHGAGLGKTTGWIHRSSLRMKDVNFIGGVNYERVGDEGLMISEGEARENPRWLDVDNVILCSGQESLRDLAEPLEAKGVTVHIVGGADKAAELDAKRAINKAARLAAVI